MLSIYRLSMIFTFNLYTFFFGKWGTQNKRKILANLNIPPLFSLSSVVFTLHLFLFDSKMAFHLDRGRPPWWSPEC